MSRTKAESMRDLRAARKKQGLKEFRAWVDPIRFEYLTKCLDELLCQSCCREEAECSADPCPAVQWERDSYVSDSEYGGTMGSTGQSPSGLGV